MRLAILSLLLLGGCATLGMPEFQPSDSDRAVVDWRHGNSAVTVQAEFQRAEDDDAVRVFVTRNATLLVLTGRNGTWTATGALARGGWRGVWNTAPPPLAGWIILCEAYAGANAAPAGESEIRTGRMSVRYQRVGGRLAKMELAAVATEDHFQVVFDPR